MTSMRFISISHRRARLFSLWICALAVCGTCAAQVAVSGQHPPAGSNTGKAAAAGAKPAAKAGRAGQSGAAGAAGAANAKAPQAAAGQTAAAPVSLLSQPAKPAKVTFAGGKLAVEADNSSLSSILRTISSDTGMDIQGLSLDQRVFGAYGPGNPREVLTSLLEGTGYNVLMIGMSHNGTPKQLVLTIRGNAPPSPPMKDEAPQGPVYPYPNPYPNQYRVQQPHPAPPPGPPGKPGAPGPVKTPQQILQELEKLRQQQQKQQG